ncbi:TIR domain-containing protein [Streptomyces atriruber]|uniref:TIR domain-containing protein n=1 Tax=Streptomyces atriruber TaxID=545121 RepID=UPI000A5946F4|nr:TIR domain-containing protein [Streptomyces atriruber]
MSPSRRPPRQLPQMNNLPPLPAPFVGRDEEIADAHRLLMDHRAVLVHDPEDRQYGYGTSQLAISYGHLYTQHYELMWVFDCARDPDPVRLADRLAEETERLHEAFEKDLGRPLDGPTAADWLYIFDNAEDPGGLRPHFPEGNARILVTSRKTGEWEPNARLLVGPLARPDAVRLLMENMGLDQRQAARLADTFDGHPHQIVRAGEAVLAGKVTVEQVTTVTEIARMAPPPPDRHTPSPALPAQYRADVPDRARTSLRSSLLRSTVCRDSGSYRRWMAALRLRPTATVLPEAVTVNLSMAERVDLLLDTVFEQEDPEFVLALADTVAAETDAAGTGRQMADSVRAIAEELAARWQGSRQASPAEPAEVPSCFFFTSWHNRDVDFDEALKFHNLLEKRVTAKLGGRVTRSGFFDKMMQHGATWEPKLIEAIRTTRLMVPLITEGYFQREWCRREWAVMVQRMANLNADPGQEPIAILPVFWVRPLDGWDMPADFGPYQHSVHSGGRPEYDGDVYDLVADDKEELNNYVSTLAQSMVALSRTRLPHLDRDLVKKLPLAFRDVNDRAV